MPVTLVFRKMKSFYFNKLKHFNTNFVECQRLNTIFLDIERKWQDNWKLEKTYKAEINEKPKYYVMDMFPIRLDLALMSDIL